MKTITTFAPGKIILSGEHSAVHGFPAVVMSFNSGVEVKFSEVSSSQKSLDSLLKQNAFFANIIKIFEEKYYLKVETDSIDVEIKTELPSQSGFGLSAAIASAFFQALLKWNDKEFSLENLYELVQENEKFAHGTPSGIDAMTVVHQGLLRFQRKNGKLEFERIHFPKEKFPPFLLLQSGRPKETTGEMIQSVRNLIEEDSSKFSLLEEMGRTTEKFIQGLLEGSFDVTSLQKNQRLLEDIGVVSPSAQHLVQDVESLGGVAKVSGGGGKAAGSGIVMCFHENIEVIREYAQQKGIEFFMINEEGKVIRI